MKEAVSMLTPIRRGAVLLATRDKGLEAMVSVALAGLGPEVPRLAKVDNLGDCVVAVRLLDPSVVLLDDGIEDAPDARALSEVREVRPSAPVVYIASQHSLDLEREVRRLGVLFYIARPEAPEVMRSHLLRVLQGLLRWMK